MRCVECGSSMEIEDGLWACPVCFSVSVGEIEEDDDTVVEEGLTLQDILQQMKEQRW